MMFDVEATVECDELELVLDRFRDRGFVVHMVMPADEPALAVLQGDGLSIRLTRRGHAPSAIPSPGLVVPPLEASLEFSRMADAGWGTGRAGMLYRDLLPTRQGGRFIASHIRILEAGPVPDQVHHHTIRFQLIFCVAGWVRLVYENQGPPFVLGAGDCVLQPPGIRHRVLESSAGLEVVEVTCPAVHETWFDQQMSLPTPPMDGDFAGQRFVRYRSAEAAWLPSLRPGFTAADTGIGDATGGLVGARVLRAGGVASEGSDRYAQHDGELLWWFLLDGTARLEIPEWGDQVLQPGDSVAVPLAMAHTLVAASDDLELLEVTVPAALAVSWRPR
jgi:mannose-6-phosphate isomerase-like protein (cupin superfamily)